LLTDRTVNLWKNTSTSPFAKEKCASLLTKTSDRFRRK